MQPLKSDPDEKEGRGGQVRRKATEQGVWGPQDSTPKVDWIPLVLPFVLSKTYSNWQSKVL